MTEKKTETDNDADSKKTLIRLLIVVAIGIPVLLEFSTFYNLIKVHLFEEKKPAQEVQQVKKPAVEGVISEGDTLFTESPVPIILKQKRINVTPHRWRFVIGFSGGQHTAPGTRVIVDSLRLQSGKMLPGREPSGWEKEKLLLFEWEIPNGDLPNQIFLRLIHEGDPDSAFVTQKAFHIGKIPVRYQQAGQ